MTSERRTSSETRNGTTSSASRADRRVRQVGRLEATDDEPTEQTGAGRGEDLARRAAGTGGQGVDAPDRGQVDAGRGVRDRATPGQERRQQAGLDRGALADAARDPRQPGAGALGRAAGRPSSHRSRRPAARRRG